MNIVCIDDVPKEGEALLAAVKSQFEKYDIGVCNTDYYSSGDGFFKEWSPGKYRMVFLDIFLEHENGIEIAKTIRKMDPRVPIIFCSTSNEFAAESYEVQANYYLVKPAEQKRIEHMIHRLNVLKKDDDMIELPDHRMLLLSQFVSSEYHNHSITVFLKNGLTEKIWSSQSDFMKLLEPFNYFLAVTPGTIINLKEVKTFDNDVFIMTDGSLVPISKRKKKELVASYRNYLFSELRRE